MPPPLLVDLSKIDMNRIELPIEEVRKYNAHRYEMEQLSGVIHVDREKRVAVGFKDVRSDEFWVRGHIPGRPLMPGIVMMEAAGQLCALLYKVAISNLPGTFLGFGGMNNVKFRRTVVPGEKLILLAHCTDERLRRVVFDTQGLVGGQFVFEGQIIGMPV